MLQASGIADLLSTALADVHLSIWLPFLLSAAVFLFLFHLIFV
ncbi:MAG: hypothetical protein ACREOO_24990 [bacterium]